MEEVFPQNYSVLLVGSPGVGKSEYCLHLAKEYLDKGEKVVFLTTKKSPADIRKRMKEVGVDIEGHEGKDFLFIDVFTRSAGTPEDTVIHIDNPANLNLVSVRLADATEVLGKPVRIIFDSLSTFFLHATDVEIRKFFESLNTKITIDYGFAIFTLQDEMHDEKVVTALKSMVGAVLEMKLEEAPSLRRRFRVLFAKGISYTQDWVDFQVTKRGFELAPIGDIPVAREEKKKPKRQITLKRIMIGVILLFFILAVLGGPEKDRSSQETSRALEDMETPHITAAPDVATPRPTRQPTEPTPPETSTPEPELIEFRLDGMEDANLWYPFEGEGAFLDITESTSFSILDNSIKITLEVLSNEDSYAGMNSFEPKLTGYDGITFWSFTAEPLPLGRLMLVLQEEDGSRYVNFRMRSLKKTGWIQDVVPFSSLRSDPWGDGRFDENGQLDLDQVQMISISTGGGGPEIEIGTYVYYLDELNLFRYQNTTGSQ